MKQRSEAAADRVASYLLEMGIRTSSKAYQYLLFALTQLQCGTPFQNSIWELTAIHFGQKRENVLACVRREINRAFHMAPDRFIDKGAGIIPGQSPKAMEFLQLGLYEICKSRC